MDSATARRMTPLKGEVPVTLREAAVTLREVAGSRPPLRCHPARSRRVQAPAAPSPCAQSQGPGPRCAVTLRAVAGSRPPLRRHPARSRRVQAPAAPSPCAKSQGPGPRCAVTLRAVAGSRPPLRWFRGSLRYWLATREYQDTVDKCLELCASIDGDA